MSYLREGTKKPEYTFVVFKKAGKYTDDAGNIQTALEPVRTLTEWQALPQSHSHYLASDGNSNYVMKVSRSNEDHFEDFDDFYERRRDLRTLRFLVSYGNATEVMDADDFVPLDQQLHFKWKDLLEKYRSVLSDVDEKENEARHALLELLYEYCTGNRNFLVQEYLDKASKDFGIGLKQAAEYLRVFEAQDFIEITEFFTIRPKKVKEFYDSFFEIRHKSGRW